MSFHQLRSTGQFKPYVDTVLAALTFSVFDAVTVSENVQVGVLVSTSVFDSVTVSESVQTVVNTSDFIFDSVTVSENIRISISLPSPVFESVTITENTQILVFTNISGISVSDIVTISENITLFIPTLVVSKFETITITEQFYILNNPTERPTETITTSEYIQISVSLPSPRFELITVSESIQISLSLPSPKFETITVSENIQIFTSTQENIFESISISEYFSAEIVSQISVFDQITTTEGPLTLSDIPGGTISNIAPGLITTVATGGMAWRTPYTDMYTRNGVSQFTNASVDGFTDIVKGSSFGFSIPSGVTIVGIALTVARPGTGGATPYYDNIASLYKSNGALTVNKVTGASIGAGAAVKTFTYGGPTDLWGETWTPADINSPEFGYAYSIRWGGGGDTGNGRFDGGTITVYYSGVVGGTYPEVHVVSNLLISDDVTVTDVTDDRTSPLEVNVYDNIYPAEWVRLDRPPIAYDAPEYVPIGDIYNMTPFGDTGDLPWFMNDSGSGY